MNPLRGKTVLVTRPKSQSADLSDQLRAQGAEVIEMPAIEIAPPLDPLPLEEAIRNLASYDWIVFTSVNGVQSMFGRVSPEAIRLVKAAAIGPATAAAVEKAFQRTVDLIPPQFVSESIAEAVGEVEDLRFLLPRADIARKQLAILLQEKGAIVDEVTAYRIVRSDATVDLPPQSPDFITLTSSSGVRSAFELLRECGRIDWLRSAQNITIGPITSATVRELGFEVAKEATEYTMAGLTDALIACAGTASQERHA